MNYYYNPYMMIPTANMALTPARTGIFSNLLNGVRGIKWGSIFNNAQRTLGFINQAIPVVKQVRPVVNNAKTMFRVMNEFKKVDDPSTTRNYNGSSSTSTSQNNNYTPEINQYEINNGPTFFI